MQKKSTFISIFLLLLIWSSITPGILSDETIWWNEHWSYRQEIPIPIPTNLEIAKYQPIDLRIEFENPCWAKNSVEHSIRVCCLNKNTWTELESQIYDLNRIGENYITSCNLVFLIPEFADGTERYYIYYDDSEKPSPGYTDHVNVEEAYYRYEPISGYPLESYYYKITDDGYIIYTIAQDGQFMGYNTSQHVTKMIDKTTEVMPKNGDLFAAFDFKYCYDEDLFDYSSTSQHFVSGEILTDGNLMVELVIISRSKLKDLQTTARYKYYHCPTTSNTRIHVSVKHETLKEIKVFPEANTDGVFASLQCGGVKSKSIKDLNFGEILPYLHISNERNSITQYALDLDPEYIPEDPDIRVLSYTDDVDLGENAWVSFDEGETGIAHAVILSSNTIVTSGTDEKNGVQINAFQMDYPHFLGLENNIATVQIGRNSYEHGGNHDLVIPEDFIVEFDAEFFSSKTGGFAIVQQEADIFQQLVKIKPSIDTGEVTNQDDKTDIHTLSVYVHLAPSTPFGSSLSAFLGKNFSYITVELYKNKEFVYAGTATRLPMKPIPEFEKLTFVEQISAALFSFDWKNFSFFKRLIFPDLPSGHYTIKIYRENPFPGKQRKYIGFMAVELTDDVTAHIICSLESSLHVQVTDQNNKPVADADVILLNNEDEVVTKNQTDKQGFSLIHAPCNRKEQYTLRILYNGFTVFNDYVKLGYLTSIHSLKKQVNLTRYHLEIHVFDTWDLPISVDVHPVLSSKEMDVATDAILAEQNSVDTYIFSNLTPATYQLNLNYKSCSLTTDVQIDSDEKLDIIFPVEFPITIKIYDARGLPLNNVKIMLTKNSKQFNIKSSTSAVNFSLPPGIYTVEIHNNGELIGARNIEVSGERTFDFITKQQPFLPLVIMLFVILSLLFSLVFSYVKNEKLYFLLHLSLSFVIIAFVFPWWVLHGSSQIVETSTQMFLIPLELVTVTIQSGFISGELAFLPEIFRDYVGLIPFLSFLGCIFLLLGMFFKKIYSRKFLLFSLTTAFFFYSGSLLIFFIGMSSLAEIGIGGFIGEGFLEVHVPGEETFVTISAYWGPNLGFYCYLISILILVFILINEFFLRNTGCLFHRKIHKKKQS